MSERNGEKSRFQINRKRAVHRRARIREMLAATASGGQTPTSARTTRAPGAPERPAHAQRRAKG